ncbi:MULTISPECIES: AAA family ATPase [Sphingobium]|uniref:AAA family ATPase n=1 Tax=Sphingobium limneticum TaxID=1007511 RepID=A0A5J5HTY5_9SPHN|nr:MULTISPECIES: ATP-binding protein [Sphingobium]KAA9012972.1 AAA family ATPase [Sphingobium limneticum]KAA9025218.1 AAA family ATPase [Sphingobium limneticum]BBD02450.1 hypothetical protein YGS_C2P0464 [Sphingobium sp. YG1]
MSEPSIFDSEIDLPSAQLAAREPRLLGFEALYARIHAQLQLLLHGSELARWSERHHKKILPICDLVTEQYPLVLFHGDVGTGKTAMAETIANRLVTEARSEDSVLFKLSNRVRGSGMVGEMGSLLSEAFTQVIKAAGKGRRAILIIDEADSLAAARSQAHSHHEDKVAVNTLIQGIDDFRQFGGRIVVILCTNRLSAIDPAVRRRAAIIETFQRPSDEQRGELFRMDLDGLGLSSQEIAALIAATGPRSGKPGWTFSDIRTRLYPAALARAYPDAPLSFAHLHEVAKAMAASPIVDDI